MTVKRAITVFYDDDTRSLAKIQESDVFNSADSLARLDILKELLSDIRDMYESGLRRWEYELKYMDPEKMKAIREAMAETKRHPTELWGVEVQANLVFQVDASSKEEAVNTVLDLNTEAFGLIVEGPVNDDVVWKLVRAIFIEPSTAEEVIVPTPKNIERLSIPHKATDNKAMQAARDMLHGKEETKYAVGN